MSMAEAVAFDNLEELTEMAGGLARFVRQAVVNGTAAHEVEKEIWQRILAMGRPATGQFFQMQGDGDLGESIEMPDAEELRRLDEPYRRTDRSIFGPFTLSHYVYGTREGQRIEFVPLDARLELRETSTRICFRIGRERFRWSKRLAERPKRSKRSWGFHLRSTAWNG